MGFRLAKTVRVPLTLPTGEQDSATPQEGLIAYCYFHLRPGFDSNEHIYECGMPGCRGAGIDCFVVQENGEVPQEIMEQLRDHANLCEGIFPLKPLTPEPFADSGH